MNDKLRMVNENKDVLVSVIVPVYNVAEYLPRCIESIINQTHQRLQIILVDDGSTDASGKICDQYAREDDRIEVLHTTNGGLVRARKNGLKVARGEYIGFVDGDDNIMEEMYEKLLGYILQDKVDFVHTGFFMDDVQGKTRWTNFEKKIYSLKENKISFLRKHTMILHEVNPGAIESGLCFKLFKAALINKAYFRVPDGQQYGEDVICLYACIMEAHSISVRPEAYYNYVIREESLSHSNNHAEIMAEKIELHVVLRKMIQEDGIYDDLRRELYNNLGYHCISFLEQIENPQGFIGRYSYRDVDRLFEKKVVLYGAGRVGQSYYNQLARYDRIQIVAWVDQKYKGIHFDYRDVKNPKCIREITFDYILIAVSGLQKEKEIRENLVGMGIEENKILWEEPWRNF